MSERPTLFDAFVDLAVYAPVGLALTAAEELPELIAKGRSRIEPQLGTARLVGQFVVAEGRRRVIRYSGFGATGGVPPRPADGSQTGTDTQTTAEGDSPASSDARRSAASKKAAGRPGTPSGSPPSSARTGATDDVPDVASLAIPGYDSLSASQVVQRLAGLSPSELAAVGRYEAATRRRRTILARVSQLQGD
ncbi:MAG: hypothetical protein J2P58_11795 [Acidimicrobiaceae bacterium]|nr:hypothetical protein [Acidimicrobiaceae bacterium]